LGKVLKHKFPRGNPHPKSRVAHPQRKKVPKKTGARRGPPKKTAKKGGKQEKGNTEHLGRGKTRT